MKKLTAVHLFLIFVALELVSRFFENKIQILNYAFVAIGFVFCYLAIRKYFRKTKTKKKFKTR